jgi:hypothetical protein
VGGSRFLSMYIQQVAALFEATIGNLKDEGTILTLKPLDTLIQLYAAQVTLRVVCACACARVCRVLCR